MGEIVKDFENQFATYIGSKFAVMVNSGSSANLALIAAIKYLSNPIFANDDEIIVPAVSWSTTYYPVSQYGAKLRFVDVDLATLNIDLDQVKEAINSKTRAIFVVNLLGNPAYLNEIVRLADEYGLAVLEDNCESLGATVSEKKAGTIGLAGTFSTFFSHHISTMEGGLIATDDEEIYQVLKSIRAHGWTRDLPDNNLVYPKTGSSWDDLFRFVLPGYNLRPLEIEAAIGRVQLSKLDRFVEVRRLNAQKFVDAMSELPEFLLQTEHGESSWFGFSLILQRNLRGKRPQLIKTLQENLIESRPIVAGNFTRNPVIKHLLHAPIPHLPNADLVHDEGLFIGNHHYDLSEEIDHLVKVLKEFERTHRT